MCVITDFFHSGTKLLHRNLLFLPHHCPVLLQIYFHPYAIYGIEGIFHLFGAVLTSHPLNLQHHMMAVMIGIFV